jgi:hypothetical protein
MTIEQTVEIHADHRLVLELPLEIPVGKARGPIHPITRRKGRKGPNGLKPYQSDS